MLPDGTGRQINVERMKCPKALFNPLLICASCHNLHQGIFKSIDLCKLEIRKDLYANIVLTGGTTMFKGLPERIVKDVVALAHPLMKAKAIATPGRKSSLWLGGSVFASLDTFSEICVKLEEYREEGVQIIHQKCYC
jgi:actin-related protein